MQLRRGRPLFRTSMLMLMLTLTLAAPPGALAAARPGMPQQASIAALLLWLAGLGWGFHAMLRHRLAAEDRLAQLETDIAFERDARAAQVSATRQQMQDLTAAWQRLQVCLEQRDTRQLALSIGAVQACIAQLQQAD